MASALTRLHPQGRRREMKLAPTTEIVGAKFPAEDITTASGGLRKLQSNTLSRPGLLVRWGTASSLYFKMVERMNCVQNQITIANRVLIRNKVAGFIIVGGQDNIQMVAGQMLGFF